MPTISEEKRIIQFGIFELDLRSGELRRNGSRIRLQEQPFQILTILLERPGEIVTREELRSRLWPADTFVDFDHSLNTAVRRLRDALGDNAESPRYVETVARRGYRFLAPVAGNGPAATPAAPAPEVPPPTRRRWWLRALPVAAVLLFGISLGWHAGHHAWPPPPGVTERPLTTNAAELPVTDGVISPDGRLLAFSDASGLYLRQVDTGETHELTLPADFKAKPAAWFPDGSHLLATWAPGPQEPAGIWEIPVFGGSPRKLVDRGTSPQVSPDGTKIVYLIAFSQDVDQIWIMQANGEDAHPVVKVDADSMLGQPAWSPDGKSIAYERGARSKNMYATQGQLEVLPLASGHPVVVFRDQQVNGTLTWVPDGRIIYSLSETAPNQNDSNLWALHVDSLGHASGAPARLTRQPGIAAFPSVTANGKRLAYFRRSIAPDVYIADLLDHGTRLSPLRRLTLDDRADFPYTWLADNRSVIFISNRNGPYSIFKQDIDKPEPELVVGGPDDLMIARLSPDSRSLLYMIRPKLGDASGVARLMRVSLDGGPPKVILSLPEMNNYQCARAPATACIVARIEGGRDRFHYFDLEKGLGAEIPSAEIRSNNAYDFNWTLSPDGRLLASARKGGIQKDPVLQVLSLTDNSRHSIPIPGWAGIHTLDWAADGKSVWATAYASSGAQALLNVDLTGKVRSVLEEDKMSLGWAIPSPDGKHLAIWRASGSSNVSMLENF